MYKLLATDLDETLLSSDGTISQPNKLAIQQAMACGTKIVLATGRSIHNVQRILSSLDLADKPNEFVISYNGGLISENKGTYLLKQQAIAFPLAQQIFQLGVSHHLLIHVFTLNHLYTYQMTLEEEAYLSDRTGMLPLTEASIDHLEQDPIIKISFQHLDRSFLESIEHALDNSLKEQLDINYSSNRYIEFNAKGVHKGNALKTLATQLHINPTDIIAVGDNMNDRTMIDYAGKGIAVANAVPELKELANYITQSTHNEHALSEVIYRFILNPVT